ncbi:MAG TPA: hypothetical protein VGG02_13390 [Chthoniobacterales bacterium]|jgi:hypothetical protein
MQNFRMIWLFVRRKFFRAAIVRPFCVVALLGLLNGCATVAPSVTQARLTMAQAIAAEPPGDYFIGRRYYKPAYHFWGYVRRPGQPWSMAQLVVLNENQKLAPDRAQRHFGFDNNYEYKLSGRFSGDKVYELVSNSFLPEFVLTGYELISTHPAPIFPSQIRGQTAGPYQLEKPE